MPLYYRIKKCGLTVVYLLFAALLFSQTVSSKKDIAVFRLAHSSGVPTEIAGRIDRQIAAVITSFKRFNVIGMQYRLGTADISSFIDKIKETKENQSEIPETVLSGEAAFTRADWERLTGAFLVFIPHITAYNETLIYEEAFENDKRVIKRYWDVRIEGSLTIIDVSGATGQRILPLSAERISKRRTEAIDSAIDGLTASVYTAIKFEPEFALTSGILAFDPGANTVTIELGKNIGIKVGDEYTLQKPVFIGGRQSLITTGFFIISEVHDFFSIGKVVYATQPIVEGDAVKESPSYGLSIQGYGGITVPLTGVKTAAKDYLRVQPTFGIRAVYGAGFHLSLLLGYEYAIQQPVGQSAALNAKPLKLSSFGMGYIGVGVCNLYAARFKITPELHLCFSGTLVSVQNDSLKSETKSTKDSSDSITASQLGGKILFSADYFITQGWTVGASTGIGYMQSLMNAQSAAQKLQNKGYLSDAAVAQVSHYNWDMLSSHLNFYLFVGITGRF